MAIGKSYIVICSFTFKKHGKKIILPTCPRSVKFSIANMIKKCFGFGVLPFEKDLREKPNEKNNGYQIC
jgi:hypothetical protein